MAVTGEYQGRRRMTLTYPTLTRAREIVWLVTGKRKREPLAKLLAGDESIPAARVFNENQLVVTDEAAAPPGAGRPKTRRRGSPRPPKRPDDRGRGQPRHYEPSSSRAAVRSMSTPSSRSSTAARSFAEWMSFVASSVSIVLIGK